TGGIWNSSPRRHVDPSMVYLLTLPFRLVFTILGALLALPFAILAVPFALLFLPFLLLRFVVKAIVGLVLFPFVLVAAAIGIVIAIVAAVFAVVVPLIVPVAIVAFCVWLVLKLASPAVVV